MKKRYLTLLIILALAFNVKAKDPATVIVPITPATDVINIFSENLYTKYADNNKGCEWQRGYCI